MAGTLQETDCAIAELWAGTLSRADRSGIRLTIRPAEASAEDADPDQGRVRHSSITSLDGRPMAYATAPSPGLVDAEGLLASRDRFHLGAMLGRGGTSVVVEAIQRTLGRTVAVKIARYDLGPGQRERFRTEARCTAWLEHPNIVPVYEAGRNFLVMRRILGSSLEEELAAGRLDLAAAVEVLLKVCDAVAFAHHRGIIHRDIKPENILVGRFGEVMLADWGLALSCTPPPDGILRAPAIGRGSTLCGGTPCYMAPEIARADRDGIGFATDVFLLGATLYRCLTGRLPFPGEDALEAIRMSSCNAWTRLGHSVPQLPQRLVELQERAMASDPAARPTVTAFQAALREWLLRSRAEAEALRELDDARRHAAAAARHRLHPHESYLDYSEAIAACDRAQALNPDLEEARQVRESACGDFMLAAVGAGEPQLARLIRRNGRMPALLATVQHTNTPGDPAMVRRLGSLLPEGAARPDVMATILADRVRLQGERERLMQENTALRLGRRDATDADRAETERRLRRAWALAGLLAGLLLLVLMRG